MKETSRYGIGALVKQARTKAGLTQDQLAAKAGTSQPAIARYETSRVVPDLETLLRLIRMCGFDLRIDLQPHDDHDEVLVAENLRLSPAERAERHRRASRTRAAFASAKRVGSDVA